MDTFYANREAWDEEVKRNNWWTRIVDEEKVSSARQGRPDIWVTPSACVPQDWIMPMKGRKVLNACGGGGQQTIILSAFGADTTTIDISPSQIKQDRTGLKKYGLEARLVEGSVTSLPFNDDEFDFILNPCSLNFIEDLEGVYGEFSRVLKKGGSLIFGITNPILYIFNEKKMEKKLVVKYTLPYSDDKSLSEKEKQKML
ncbi:MAG: class I SAM-dependent methyltransferase, partial [Candidatus Ornithospirochaeta sp.]